jgi:excisionase family DNA binding protein
MLTYQALARATGIRVATLYAMVCRGEVPHFRLGPRIIRFAAREIAEWMAARHQPARPSNAT